MVVANPCLSIQALRGYLRNEVPDADAVATEAHLAGCVACGGRLQGLVAEDELARALHAAPVVQNRLPRGAALDGLQRRVARLCPTGALPTPHPSTLDTSSGRPEEPLALDVQGYLDPPQALGEVGRLGGYRVQRVLGRGGMGVVLLAHDDTLDRRVALKLMLPALAAVPEHKDRFRREAQTMARLSHPHVVRVYQIGEANGLSFLAMEYLEGQSLDDWLATTRKRSLGEILRIGREMAEGLAAAHAQGLVHRDVKPSNVWLEGDKKSVKLLDFGLARVAEGQKLTATGALVGTPAYMSPEQADGRSVDHRADLFSLGCVLYQMCSNKLPFPGKTPMQILASMVRLTPKPLHAHNPQTPPALAGLVRGLLEKDPARRPASASDVVAALRKLERERNKRKDRVAVAGQAERPETVLMSRPATLAAPADLAPAPPPEPAGARRWRPWAIGGVAGALLVGVGVAMALLFGPPAKAPEPLSSPTDAAEKSTAVTPVIKADPKLLSEKGKPLFEGSSVSRPASLPGVRTWGIVPRRHKGRITCMATNPQGTVLAVASMDGVIRLWDAGSKRLLKVLAGPPGLTYWLAFSPDGAYLSADSYQRSGVVVSLWHVPSGKRVRAIPNDSETFAEWSPDGKRLVYSPNILRDELRRLDLATLGEVKFTVASFARPTETARRLPVAFSPDGARLAVASNPVRIYDTNDGKELITLDKQEYVTQVSYSPAAGGGLFVAGAVARLVVGREEHRIEIKGAGRSMDAGVWSADGKRLIVYRDTPTWIGVYNADTKRLEKATQTTNLPWLKTLLWLADGKTLVTREERGELKILFIDYEGNLVDEMGPYDGSKHGHFRTSPEGHYDGSKGVEKEIVYVTDTEDGQQTYTPAEFAKKFKWKNDPTKVQGP